MIKMAMRIYPAWGNYAPLCINVYITCGQASANTDNLACRNANICSIDIRGRTYVAVADDKLERLSS